jgi:hypothetical protein
MMRENEDIRPAQGVINGVIISILFWVVAALIVIHLSGCTTGFKVSFGVSPVTSITEQQELRQEKK